MLPAKVPAAPSVSTTFPWSNLPHLDGNARVRTAWLAALRQEPTVAAWELFRELLVRQSAWPSEGWWCEATRVLYWQLASVLPGTLWVPEACFPELAQVFTAQKRQVQALPRRQGLLEWSQGNFAADAPHTMYLSNPDSLSGQILSRHELSDLVARLPPSWQLVLDLTHASPSDETALGVRELLTAHKNVWVVRDGRGVHGLPQLSATLLQAHPEALGRVQDVWTHADASTCVALAKAWEDRAFRTQWHKLVLTRRQQAVRELRERGFSVTAGQGPFMLVLLPPERVAFGHRLSEVLPEFVWITMGDSCGWRIPVARRELWNQWMQILDTTWTQLYGTF